ncbi:MAG: hypothetical protein WCO03_00680 [bacterium]
MPTIERENLFTFIIADTSAIQYRADDASERVSAKFRLYYKLVECGYSAVLIDVDVLVGEQFADIVVYEDYEHSQPKLLIECLPSGATIEDVADARIRAEEKAGRINCPHWARAIGDELLEDEYLNPDFK